VESIYVQVGVFLDAIEEGHGVGCHRTKNPVSHFDCVNIKITSVVCNVPNVIFFLVFLVFVFFFNSTGSFNICIKVYLLCS